jgi:lipopolysaccharide biosynthesis glycosyltransferase
VESIVFYVSFGGVISDLANDRYNVTPSAAYTYAPAYRRYGHKINAVHFIGPNKPWASLKHRPPGTPNLDKKDASYDCKTIIRSPGTKLIPRPIPH